MIWLHKGYGDVHTQKNTSIEWIHDPFKNNIWFIMVWLHKIYGHVEHRK